MTFLHVLKALQTGVLEASAIPGEKEFISYDP